MRKVSYLFILLFLTAITFTSCRDAKSTEDKAESKLEKAADKVEDAGKRAKEELKGAADDVKEELDGETDDN